MAPPDPGPEDRPAGGRPRHTLPGWQRITRRAVLSLAKRSLSPGAKRLASKVAPFGTLTGRFLRSVEGIEVEVCGAPFRLDVLRRSVSRSVYLGGRWHSPVVSMLRAHVKPGMTVVDVGANVGFMAAHMADRAGPDGQVLAFEPEPWNFSFLSRNARRVRYRNVVPIQAAIGDACGTASLYLSARDGGDHRIVAGATERRSIKVPLTTLDAVARDRRATIHFVKMDIQGAEGAAVRGMTDTLASPHLRGVVLEFWPKALLSAGDDPLAILAQITRSGLACASHPAVDRDPRGFLSSISPGGSTDLLFLR